MHNQEESLFCRYCPCAAWCDGNAAGNEKATGYSFIPDPDHCKHMFEKEEEITFNEFFRSVFLLHGSTVNEDWRRFLEPEEEGDHGDIVG